jgi:hypothetical protein
VVEKPSDGNWLGWVNRNYPFAEDWEAHLRVRTERPVPGSPEQLDDLMGLRDRSLAALLAELWFRGVEQADEIARSQRLDRAKELEKERERMIRVAKIALDGKLGDTRESREAAQATANKFIGTFHPEQCDYHQLRDWDRMHRYSRAMARGEKPPMPTLWRQRQQKARQQLEIDDINNSIPAEQAGRPRTEQQNLGNWQ